MFKRALVTGGAGFIGSHLARSLLLQDMEVVVLDNLSMGKNENVPKGAEFVCGDVRSGEDVSRVLGGVDIVFHEAARVSIRSSVEGFYEDADNNLMGRRRRRPSERRAGPPRLQLPEPGRSRRTPRAGATQADLPK